MRPWYVCVCAIVCVRGWGGGHNKRKKLKRCMIARLDPKLATILQVNNRVTFVINSSREK